MLIYTGKKTEERYIILIYFLQLRFSSTSLILTSKMESVERCFICGTRVNKSNLPSPGSVQERMNKLISVSQTVEHSSTIISDILSRILNKTVMREETICRVCFNLLNDIDYHLKEAQEKTDEITCKFLDKEKDPNKYKPTPIMTASEEDRTPPLKTINIGSKKASSKKRKSSRRDQEDILTEDEMSVNSLNKNKQKLLISVLHPSKKSRLAAASLKTEREEKSTRRNEEEDSLEDEEYILSTPTPANKKSKKKKKKNSTLRKENIENGSELVTVNMDDLGDLFSKPKEVFFAKKSEPCDEDYDSAKSESPIKCGICEKIFKRKSNLQIHLEKVHQVNNHVKFNEEEIPETHRCDLCPREFVNEKSLALHRVEHELVTESKSPSKVSPQTSYGENSKAKCPKCDKTFKRVFNMRIHVDRVHNKTRPFPCNTCDKSFATNSDLKQHMTVHGKGKIFKCEECGREFTNRDSIILHRKQHNNHRTHFCNVCDKGFFKASCLTRHLRTHTGEKPFKCEHCGKAFTQSTTVKIHRAKCGKNPTA